MLNAKKLFILLPISLMVSGCMVSGPLALIGSSTGHLIKANFFDDDRKENCGPMTVDRLLANARGDKPTDRPKTAKTDGNAISVEALLAQARITPDADTALKQSIITPTLEVALPADADIKDIASTVRQKLRTQGRILKGEIQIGTGGNEQERHRLFSLMPRVRELAEHLQADCRCNSFIFDPSLPTGRIRFDFRKGHGDA